MTDVSSACSHSHSCTARHAAWPAASADEQAVSYAPHGPCSPSTNDSRPAAMECSEFRVQSLFEPTKGKPTEIALLAALSELRPTPLKRSACTCNQRYRTQVPTPRVTSLAHTGELGPPRVDPPRRLALTLSILLSSTRRPYLEGGAKYAGCLLTRPSARGRGPLTRPILALPLGPLHPEGGLSRYPQGPLMPSLSASSASAHRLTPADSTASSMAGSNSGQSTLRFTW